MSKFEQLKTSMTDGTYLVEALREMGFDPQVDWNGQVLRGYGGTSWPERAQVIVPKRQLAGALADIGFVRDPAGVYRVIIDDMDRQYTNFNDAWIGRVAQTYKEKQTIAAARAKGYVFKGREVIESQGARKVRLRFSVR